MLLDASLLAEVRPGLLPSAWMGLLWRWRWLLMETLTPRESRER